VSLALGVGNEPALGLAMVFMSGYWTVLAIGIFWWTVHNLRQGEPRPSLERPSALIGVVVPLFAFEVLAFGQTLVGGSNSPPIQWRLGDVFGLVLLIGSVICTGLWIFVTSRRWSVSYARKHTRATTGGHTAT
jgi:hypothetical protein